MKSITASLITIALLILLPIAYFLVAKIGKSDKDKPASPLGIVVFLFAFLVVTVLGLNLRTMLINHDARVVAQRYVTSLLKNTIHGDETRFLNDVNSIAYPMENTETIFNVAKSFDYAKVPGLMISKSAPKDSEGNVYLYVLTQDTKICLDVELKPSGPFYDVYAVKVLTQDERDDIVNKETFSPIW